MRVTTADFVKHYGSLADRALTESVTITKKRPRPPGCSFGRGIRAAQAPGPAGELTEDEIALIAKAEVPADACNKAR